MRLSRAFIDEYNAALHALQGAAADEFRAVMQAWHEANPGASVAEAREFCIAAATDVSERYGGVSSELAAQMFDEVCGEEGIGATAEVPEQLVDPEMVEGAARYDAGKLVGGDWAGFVEAEARKVDNNVRRAAYDTVERSCRDNDVRWARVPSGRETCGYCFMLASRGFVYTSEGKAHNGSHVGCDCTVVPGRKGSTSVEGYDPDALRERWEECRDAAGSSDIRDIIYEVESRDWDWVWAGKESQPKSSVDYSDNPREAYGRLLEKIGHFDPDDYREENIVDRGNEWRDLFVHDALANSGFAIKTMDGAHIDLVIDGNPWEVKSPYNPEGGTRRTVEQNLRKALKQFEKAGIKDKTSVIFSSRYLGVEDSKTARWIEELKLKHGIASVLFIDKSGAVSRIE